MTRVYKGAIWGPPDDRQMRACAGAFETLDLCEVEQGIGEALLTLQPGFVLMIEVVHGEGRA